KQAHKRLGDVSRLAVGIPRRGVLMAIAGDRPNCLAPFQLIVQDIYLDSGDEAIRPQTCSKCGKVLC
ncbi:hypothetical protein HC928_19965, partial [bacterium]|nr:hypothetical protein [bacterium]